MMETKATKSIGNRVREVQIHYQRYSGMGQLLKISCSRDAAGLLFEHWDKGTLALQEHFKIILMDRANRVKGIHVLAKGGIAGVLVDVRILFAVALKSLSVGIVLAHNHPSGVLSPSHADVQLTQRVQRAAELFDIHILDHIILGPDGDYYSFADDGKL